jgi:hypothetical protein
MRGQPSRAMIESERMKIHEAPHGINVVIETQSRRVVIGRFDSTNGFTALLHDCDVVDFAPDQDPEPYIRETAKYGVDVKQRDLEVDVLQIARVRVLGEIQKAD